ncbi:DUF3558 domain-containing protein [Nocardia abscessus]|uniref:DUF3558 domain-containing protein n=1 Tax=Nocardia abscessus TaxID=120957 RepID=A0ABS0C9B4_9NOCA|nr:DUF3558 domain-containing protein [Nocardia abscessus]MBF6226761.1 DUF3558 domain-containing protein [Nocardia abscessus]
MTSGRNSWRLAVLAVGAALVLAGCESSADGNDQPTGNGKPSSQPSVATDAPSGYDTCKDIPQSVLDSEKLRRQDTANSDANGGLKWRGCVYGRTDGYFATITTTNVTVDMTRAKNFSGAEEFAVNGRKTITSRQSEGRREACVANVAMNNGSLDISVLNPASNRDTGQMDSCDIARMLAEKIAPTMPANA